MKESEIIRFIDSIALAQSRLKGVSDALDCISRSEYFKEAYSEMIKLFSDECLKICEMMDISD